MTLAVVVQRGQPSRLECGPDRSQRVVIVCDRDSKSTTSWFPSSRSTRSLLTRMRRCSLAPNGRRLCWTNFQKQGRAGMKTAGLAEQRLSNQLFDI